jgi:hypothetical protein
MSLLQSCLERSGTLLPQATVLPASARFLWTSDVKNLTSWHGSCFACSLGEDCDSGHAFCQSFCLRRLQSEFRCRDNLITALHFAPEEIRADVYLASASVTELEYVFDNRAETAMQLRMQLGKAAETSTALCNACVVSLKMSKGIQP